MKRFLTLSVVIAVMAGVSAAAPVTYNTQGAWQAAVGNWVLFPFTGNFNASAGPTTINPTFSGPNTYAAIVGNVYQDVLSTGTASGSTDPNFISTTTYTWSGGSTFGAGGLWNTAPVNEGGKINITLNLVGGGTQFVSTIGPINGFFGWTNDVAFNSFTLTTNLVFLTPPPFGAEHYTVDNLQIAAVPEPATLSIVGLSLLGLGALGRRYRRR